MSLLEALKRIETKLKKAKCTCKGDGWNCLRCSNLNRIGPIRTWLKDKKK